MDWMEQFIDKILREVPKGRYRTRAEKELRDHMETQYRVLTEGGWTPQEAQEEVLRTMGEPEQLQKEYETVWRRSPDRTESELGDVIASCVAGCLVMGALYIFTLILLGMVGFGNDAVYPIGGNKISATVFSTVLFLIPFTLGALFLRFCFRKERRPVGLVTAGLLAAWVGERMTVILLSAMIYGMPLGLDLLARIYCDVDETAPWFTPANYVLTFLGCILLGQLFGRLAVKERKKRAA